MPLISMGGRGHRWRTWAAAACLSSSVLLVTSPTAGTEAEDVPVADAAVASAHPAPADILATERALTPLGSEYGSATEQRWRAILADEGLREGENDGDVFVASATATVSMDKGIPGWIEARRIAFDVAYARSKAAMVRHIAQTVEATGDMRFVENAVFGQSYMEEVEALGQSSRILRKISDFTEASLDTAISALDPDYDPSRYSGMSAPARETALENLYRQAIVRAGSRMIGGATTFQVLEGPTADGYNHEILVALIWTPTLSRLAATIDNGRAALPTGLPGQPVTALLPATVGEAVASFGTRVFIDDRGHRAILAFGQAEPARVGARDRELARRAAITRAENYATALIAAFVSENVAFRDPVSSQEITRAYADLVERGVRVEIEQVESIRTATATISLSGIEIVWRQVIQHPETEQDIAIVAALWSPSGQASAAAMGHAIDHASSPDIAQEGAPRAAPETDLPVEAEGLLFERPRPDRSAY